MNERGGQARAHLVELRIEHVPRVKRDGEDHAVGDAPDALVLPRDERQVEHDPEDQARAHLVERLDVKVAEARVEAATDEPLCVRGSVDACESEREGEAGRTL